MPLSGGFLETLTQATSHYRRPYRHLYFLNLTALKYKYLNNVLGLKSIIVF